jgi:hypothetical protein
MEGPLTPEQHQTVLLNIKVNLVWFNVDGKFIGPYITPEDFQKYIQEQ